VFATLAVEGIRGVVRFGWLALTPASCHLHAAVARRLPPP